MRKGAGDGFYGDADHFHYVDHVGPSFSVKVPINLPRPPQGHPVLIQAGVSDSFVDLAAQNAEVIFVVMPKLELASVWAYKRFHNPPRNSG